MFETLKAKSLAARKAKDKPTLMVLSTLIGNLQANAKMVDGVKVVTDDAVVAMIRYNLKGLNEMIKHAPNDEEVKFEIDLLQSLLPKQLTEDELRAAIAQIIEGGSMNMGMVMKELKAQYTGLYDGRIASSMVKAALEAY